MLEDFEREDALGAWSARQVELSIVARPSPTGAGSSRAARCVYPRWVPGRGKWPAVILEHGDGQFETGDWSIYHALRFEARNHHDRTVHLKLRIDDADGRRAVRILPIGPHRWDSYEVLVAGLADDIDAEHVRRVDFYMSQPAAEYSIALDDLRLEATPIAVEEAGLYADPFGQPHLAAHARFNQRVDWRVEVAGTAGGPGVEFTGNGTRLLLREALPSLPPGRYGVTLSAAAPARPAIVASLGVIETSASEAAPVVAWVAPSTQKVLLNDLPSAGARVFSLAAAEGEGSVVDGPIRLAMARGEAEAFQLVFRSSTRSADVSVEAGGVEHTDADARFAAAAVSVRRVLYVETQQPEEYNVDHVGWWPDPIVPGTRFRLEPGENAPVWITLRSAGDQQPGRYCGAIRVRLAGHGDTVLPLEVRVYPVTVPTVTTVQTAFSLYEHSLSQVYGPRLAKELLPRYRQAVAAHRLNVTNIYTDTPPSPEVLADLRERGQLNRFVALHVSTGEYDRRRLEELAAILDPFMAAYRRLGLSDRALIYGFDEARGPQFGDMKKAFAFLKQRYPEVRTATTAVDPSLGMDTGLAAVVDVWVPLTAYHDPVAAAVARERGAQVWWYICIAPTRPHANWFIEYSALEARLLWWMSHRQRVDGFLYYTLNRWPGHDRPLTLPAPGNKSGWNPASFGTANGDGCLLYPGPDGPVTSMRLENITDGIEDLELLRALAAHSAEQADRLCDAVAGPGITGFTRDAEHFARTRLLLLQLLSAVAPSDASRP